MSQKLVDGFLAGWNDGNMDGLDAVVGADYVCRAPAGMLTQMGLIEAPSA